MLRLNVNVSFCRAAELIQNAGFISWIKDINSVILKGGWDGREHANFESLCGLVASH